MISRILAFVFLVSSGSAQAALVGFYNFNLGDGTDASGLGNHATLVGAGVSFLPAGGPGSDGAASFTGAANSIINVPININASNIPQLTMGAWIKPASAGNPIGKILSHDNGGFDRTVGFDNRGGAGISLFTGAGVSGSEVVATEEWHFVAVRYNGTNAILNVNTSQLSVTDHSSNNVGETFTQIAGNPNFNEFFIGEMDNVFFYDEALSDNELENIRLNGVSPVPLPGALMLMLGALPMLGFRKLG